MTLQFFFIKNAFKLYIFNKITNDLYSYYLINSLKNYNIRIMNDFL